MGYLIVAMVFALLAMLNNFQFGLALAASLGGALVIMILVDREMVPYRRMAAIGGWALILIIIPALVIYITGLVKNSMLVYYLGGFAGPPFSIERLVFTMMAISAGYAFLSYFGNAPRDLKYLALLLMFYSQGLFIYYTWGNTQPHILNIAPILALCAVVFVKLIVESTNLKEYRRLAVLALIVLSLCFVYLPGSFAYSSAKNTFDKNFTDHKAYEWRLGRASFVSTMDPKPFLDSISLIEEFDNSSFLNDS